MIFQLPFSSGQILTLENRGVFFLNVPNSPQLKFGMLTVSNPKAIAKNVFLLKEKIA